MLLNRFGQENGIAEANECQISRASQAQRKSIAIVLRWSGLTICNIAKNKKENNSEKTYLERKLCWVMKNHLIIVIKC